MGSDRVVQLEKALGVLRSDILRTSSAGSIESQAVDCVARIVSFHVANQSVIEDAARLDIMVLVRDLDRLQDGIQEMIVRLADTTSPILRRQYSRRLITLAIQYGSRLIEGVGTAQSVDLAYLQVLIGSAEQLAERTARAELGETSGTSASADLHVAYEARGSRELRLADLWRLAAISVVLVTGTAIFCLLLQRADGSTSVALQKLSLTIPGATLFGYFANQSRHHREAGTKLSDVAVRLETIDAYCERFDDSTRLELLAAFGRSLFTVAPSGDEQGPPETSVESIDTLLSVLQRVQSLQSPAAVTPVASTR